MIDVSVVKCKNYTQAEADNAIADVLKPFEFIENIKPGCVVGIKTNLVAGMKPETAVVTHPALLAALVRLLKSKGANVIVGDSPGGLYTPAYVSHIYRVAGMGEVEAAGAELNSDFNVKTVDFPGAKVLKNFTYTAWLDKCDVIINFSKLKSHGMMGMSAATKNMFGAIPGATKPEYHFRFPNHRDFSAMLVDINEYFKPSICICDAVEGMEGNGPTQGTPRHIGAVLASPSPYKLDLVAAKLIGLDILSVPTLNDSLERGFIPDSADKLSLNCDVSDLIVKDYKNVPSGSLLFDRKSKLVGKLLGLALTSKPTPKKSQCIGCAKCANICPAKAIKMTNKKPHIDRKTCIRCFCCQEFCPVGAMKVHRPLVAKVINKK